jgi:hypothetical protein
MALTSRGKSPNPSLTCRDLLSRQVAVSKRQLEYHVMFKQMDILIHFEIPDQLEFSLLKFTRDLEFDLLLF